MSDLDRYFDLDGNPVRPGISGARDGRHAGRDALLIALAFCWGAIALVVARQLDRPEPPIVGPAATVTMDATSTATPTPTPAQPAAQGSGTPGVVIVRIATAVPTRTPKPSPSQTPKAVCGETAQQGQRCWWPTSTPTPRPTATLFPTCSAQPDQSDGCLWRASGQDGEASTTR